MNRQTRHGSVPSASARSRRSRHDRRLGLAVETLEARTLLTTGLGMFVDNPTAQLVGGIYQDLLRRTGSPAEVSGWALAVDAGMGLDQVTQQIELGTEYRTTLVREEPWTLLG